MATVQITKCDKCGNVIAKGHYYVAAGVYGIDLHTWCFAGMTALEVLKILNLDDIRWGKEGGNDFEKFIYSNHAAAMLYTHCYPNEAKV